METTSTQKTIIEQSKQYLETKFRLLKYEGIDQASGIIAELITDLNLIVFLLLTFLLFTVTLALFAGQALHSAWQGFGTVTILYIILSLAAKLLKIRFQNIFIRIFIRKMFRQRRH